MSAWQQHQQLGTPQQPPLQREQTLSKNGWANTPLVLAAKNYFLL